jgi:hypothetical protein
LLRITPLFVPHERIAAAARALGAHEITITGVGDAALLTSLSAYFSPSS